MRFRRRELEIQMDVEFVRALRATVDACRIAAQSAHIEWAGCPERPKWRRAAAARVAKDAEAAYQAAQAAWDMSVKIRFGGSP